MTAILRFVGILNAAVWCGASIFLVIALPAVFSDALKSKIGPMGPPGVGWAAEAIFARYFLLQYFCAGIGLAHLALESLCCGKPFWRRNLAILGFLLALALAGGLWMQPKLNDLHQTKYFGPTRAAQEQADHAFKAWHGASECGNLVVMGGLLVYLWRISRVSEQARYGTLNLGKIRG